MGHTFVLQRAISVRRPLDEVFAFFADAANLERITPPWLHFEIATPRPIHMAEGTKIAYRLKLHGVPLRWTSEIAGWEPPVAFIDRQISGPYRLWHHTHRFEPLGESTRITDQVRYELPFGPFGVLTHTLFVRRSLNQIFDYRAARMGEMFGAVS